MKVKTHKFTIFNPFEYDTKSIQTSLNKSFPYLYPPPSPNVNMSYVNLFESHSRIFHLYENTDVTIASEGLKNSCISSALVTFENGGMFIVPCLLLHGISIYRSYQLSRLLRHVKNTEELFSPRSLKALLLKIEIASKTIEKNNNKLD